MRIVTEPFPASISTGSAIAIGKFDGVHLGHRSVLRSVIDRARALEVESIAVTFDRNPLETIAPGRCPPAIITLERKLQRLADVGVDIAVVIRFDEERAAQSAEDFVQDLLVRRLAARVVTVGADFRFGAKGAGDLDLLRSVGAEAGFETIVAGDVGIDGYDRVSSSRIRSLVGEGRVREAAHLLGAPPSMTGEVVHGQARGRTLGVPTANLAPDSVGLRPAHGVYAGWILLGPRRIPAAISVSDNPTFGGEQTQVEAHAIDTELELYGRVIEVEFQERIRGIENFDSVDDLVARMRDDIVRARAILGTGRVPDAG